jgi:hypothetical protein
MAKKIEEKKAQFIAGVGRIRKNFIDTVESQDIAYVAPLCLVSVKFKETYEPDLITLSFLFGKPSLKDYEDVIDAFVKAKNEDYPKFQ